MQAAQYIQCECASRTLAKVLASVIVKADVSLKWYFKNNSVAFVARKIMFWRACVCKQATKKIMLQQVTSAISDTKTYPQRSWSA